jgi:hypothetical protein
MAARHRRSRRLVPLRRRLGLEPNALRRPADHVESSIIVTLLFVFVIGAPLLGLVAGRSSYETNLRAERTQEARQQVTARLTASAPAPAPGVDGAAPPRVPAAAQWTYAGVVHAGAVPVRPGTKADTQVPIWVDGNGRAVNRPRSHCEMVGHAVIVGVASVFFMAFAVWLAGFLVRRVFIHRHLAAWDAGWSVAEPRWSGRTGS